jgi:hypothetical protein
MSGTWSAGKSWGAVVAHATPVHSPATQLETGWVETHPGLWSRNCYGVLRRRHWMHEPLVGPSAVGPLKVVPSNRESLESTGISHPI